MSLELYKSFESLWEEIAPGENFPEVRPLVAHYTSLTTLESILTNDEIWFSNPLVMNDSEELRFGMMEGASAFRTHQGVKDACHESHRFEILLGAFEHYFREFDQKYAYDTYALCFSKHEPDNEDGLLSMWRGYGGNGSGAAIVFDLSMLNVNPKSPFLISKVFYGSREKRLELLVGILDKFANLLSDLNIPDDQLYHAGHVLLERLKTFAIFTKHSGFHEECEWRVVYWIQRDSDQMLTSMLDYSIGPRGLEPRLKFPLKPIEGLTAEDFGLEKIVSKIILGPSISNYLSVKTIHRMVEKAGKDSLIERIVRSTTPFRVL